MSFGENAVRKVSSNVLARLAFGIARATASAAATWSAFASVTVTRLAVCADSALALAMYSPPAVSICPRFSIAFAMDSVSDDPCRSAIAPGMYDSASPIVAAVSAQSVDIPDIDATSVAINSVFNVSKLNGFPATGFVAVKLFTVGCSVLTFSMTASRLFPITDCPTFPSTSAKLLSAI